MGHWIKVRQKSRSPFSSQFHLHLLAGPMRTGNLSTSGDIYPTFITASMALPPCCREMPIRFAISPAPKLSG